MINISVEGNQVSWKTLYAIVTLIYLLSHGLMLLLYGAWWDDMLFWNVSKDSFYASWEVFNNPILINVIGYINRIDGLELRTIVFRLLSFLCWFVSLSCFFLIIKEITRNKQFTLYASMLVASCGLNKCMVLICCLHYTISITLFMLGLLFFCVDYNRRSIKRQFVYSSLWLLSLLIWRSAVLVIPIFLMIVSWAKTKPQHGIVQWISYMFHNYYIVIACYVLFLLLYMTILHPTGVYSDYYSIKIRNVILSPITALACSLHGFISYLGELFHLVAYLFGSRFLVLCFLFLALLYYRLPEGMNNNCKGLLLIAFLLYIFSIMPHMFIKYIRYEIPITGYDSRLLSLAIYPLCVILTSTLFYFGYKWRILIVSIMVVLSVVYSNNIYIDYARGWLRNECIASFLRNNDYLDGKIIKIMFTATDYNVNTTTGCDASYEYEGCARYAYGPNSKTQFHSYYSENNNCEDQSPDYYMICLKNKDVPSAKTLIFDRFLNPDRYEKEVGECLIIRAIRPNIYYSIIKM